jgi:alpha-L-arabinofuranosidase
MILPLKSNHFLKSIFRLFLLFIMLAFIFPFTVSAKNDGRKVYLFAYATNKNNGKDGLHFAWSSDKLNWHAVGPEYGFLKCDYGDWGSQKRMIAPFLFRDSNGLFHCLWSVNEKDEVFAYTTTTDLINWKRQSYIPVKKADGSSGNVLFVEGAANQNGNYTVSWFSGDSSGKNGSVYEAFTKDFKNYTKTALKADRKSTRLTINLFGETQEGSISQVEWRLLDNLIKNMESEKFRAEKNTATPKKDSAMFAGLNPVSVKISIDASKSKKISNMLTGVFFEDINYAADGGLYAELIQNRDFEYNLNDKLGEDKNWTHQMAWSGTFSMDSLNGIHPNNAHYAIIKNSAISNEGFDGIPVIAGERYDFSIFAKGTKCNVKLIGPTGIVLADATITPGTSWKKYTTVLKPSATTANAHLEISTQGETALDMVSLFPQKTFKNRKNGLRADLATAIADMHPKFVRFPGGCLAHGDGINNIYRWKNTLGALESRKPMRNIWNYHQTMGLGFFEYFQFCEDIGAEPVPVIAAGVPCQNSRDGGAGQQCGIPMKDMDEYVQDVLDLIEYANGSTDTKWGKVRAQTGHVKPFNLKYIGIGNEDLITDVFEERYTMIVKAVQQKYPNITIIGTVGPFYQGTDYVEGWALADKLNLPMVDEHYYNSPGWFINNQDFYDSYDRSKSKVYLGEYASWGNTFYNALAESLYLTAVERNGDVVSMASYAPLLAREKHTQWNPDLIYFNGTEIKPTVNYYVQKMYGENPGDNYLYSHVKLSEKNTEAEKRIGISAVTDNTTGDIIIKLVNMLPVAVTPSIEFPGIIPKGNAAYTVLSGTPENKQSRPVISSVAVQEAFTKQVPPYSFTIIRVKTK